MKQMLTRKPFSKMKGITLLETMLSIAVGIVVVGGALTFFASTKAGANATKAVSDMNSIVAAFNSYVSAGNSIPATGALQAVKDAGFLPAALNSAWGQAYSIDSSTAGQITITIPGIGGTNDSNCKTIGGMVNSPTMNASTATDCKFTYTL